MPLPKTFQFSATSLQDYVDCSRRFQLRYLLQVAWPAPEAEPIGEQERHARLARDFHRLVHQHLLGIPTETLTASVHDPNLERWWQAYLAYVPNFGSAQMIPEVGLSTPLAGYRVVAQYDVIVLNDQRSAEEESRGTTADIRRSLLIVDWKTYRQRPSRAWLAGRLQTRIYPMVLVQAGASLINRAHIEPDDVEMRYWLAEFPQAPESFPYDTVAYQADLDYLSALTAEIAERIGNSGPGAESAMASATEVWPLTNDLRHCRFCNYRSLCGRGGVAGSLADQVGDEYGSHLKADESDLGFDLDWGQVQEIAY
jgi:hypothetical protein